MVAWAKQRGFTLIELLMALGIVAVLALLALPAYRAPVAEAERARAATCLLSLGALLEQHTLMNGGPAGFAPDAADLGCRRALDRTYRFEVRTGEDGGWGGVSGDDARWQLRAIQREVMAGGDCHALVLRYDGGRAASDLGDTLRSDADTLRRCWH